VKPEQLRFSRTHEWVHVKDESGVPIATVGISEFAVRQLTDLVYIELPEVGRQVAAGEPFGEIESVKAVSDLYSPVAGQIVAVNDALRDSLEIFGSDPYGGGWIVKVQLSDPASVDQLLDYSAYQQQCAEEA
jgi:glycine cleavage system H protein